MNNYIIYSLVASVLLSVSLYIIFIPMLRKLKSYQYIRKEGPKSHYTKQFTPTMGGIVFIITTLVVFYLCRFIFERKIAFNLNEFLVLFPFVSFGLIGFLDDMLVVLKKDNGGLTPRLKFILQIMVSIIYFYMYLKLGYPTVLRLFNYEVDLMGFYGVLILVILVGFSNAVNLTDGLDGLAGGISVIVLIAFAYLLDIGNMQELEIFSLVLIGSLIGFLCFNFKPAKIFMGDTGSLALGGGIASIAILSGKEVLLFIIGLAFIIETLSVMLQVSYFKYTRGKRIFRMTPIHHHFELGGMKEVEIVLMFYIFSALCALLGVFLGQVFY